MFPRPAPLPPPTRRQRMARFFRDYVDWCEETPLLYFAITGFTGGVLWSIGIDLLEALLRQL